MSSHGRDLKSLFDLSFYALLMGLDLLALLRLPVIPSALIYKPAYTNIP
jgi:hypothetical protein